MFIFEQIKKLTNLKALLSGTDKGGTCYLSVRHFKVIEPRHSFGLYILHVIAPSPRFEIKFIPQCVNSRNGIFCFNHFGPNLERRH